MKGGSFNPPFLSYVVAGLLCWSGLVTTMSNSLVCHMVRRSWENQAGWIQQQATNRPTVVISSHGTTGTRSLSKFLRMLGSEGFHYMPLLQNLTMENRSHVRRFLDAVQDEEFGGDSPVPDFVPYWLKSDPGARLLISWRPFGEWQERRMHDHSPGVLPFAFLLGGNKSDWFSSYGRTLVQTLPPRSTLGNWQAYASQLLLQECLAGEALVVGMFSDPDFCQGSGPRDIANFAGRTFPKNRKGKPLRFPGCAKKRTPS